MLTIIISMIVCGALGVVVTKKVHEEDYWGNALNGIAFGFVVGLIVAFSMSQVKADKTNSMDIVSIQDNSQVEGSFMLGSGSISGRMVYTFYYKTDKGFKLKQLPHKNVTIRYSDTARAVKYFNEDTDAIKNWFAIDIAGYYEHYEIFVPEGTIKHNYNLDAQ